MPRPPIALPSGSTLAFSDDFSGDALNTALWNANWQGAPGAATAPVDTAEVDCYRPDRVAVGGGELRLTAEARACTVAGKTYPYTSGLVDTDHKFEFTDGYAVARIWTPAGAGLWPAFWLDGQHWPRDGEVDVLEAFGTDWSTFHLHSAAGERGGGVDVPGATAGWHTYAVYRTDLITTWYYDGAPVFATREVPHTPMYLILNLAVSSASAAAPATLRVDYVRVWETGG